MDSDELRKMSLNNANLAMNQMNGMNEIKTNSSGNFVLSDEHKEGLMKMMDFFKSVNCRYLFFNVHIGLHRDGTEQWIEMTGLGIYNHLNGVYTYEVYGKDGRDILNGIRKCYMKVRKLGATKGM
jgi:hypothetical protein